MGDSVFDMSEMLESINGGVDRYDMQQMYPISGNISNAVVGQGQASGLTTFQWQDSANWWSPCQSYFSLILTFHSPGNTVADPALAVAYADNFVMTLFSQLNSYINSRPLDTVNTPWLIDTALTYSNAKNTFLKSWGSLSRVGEPLTTRIRNITVNNGQIEVIFRPPLSIFDVKLLPPGAQFRIDFNWNSNGILAFESVDHTLTWDTTFASTTAGTASIRVDSFSFYKAAVHPGNGISLPARGVVDLMPCQALQYFVNSGNILKQNITMPPTTNRILMVFQDTSQALPATIAVDNLGGVGNGYNPATSFSTIFAKLGFGSPATFTADAVYLNQLWLNLPELGIQEPNPVYTFDTSANSKDLMRAYGDFCQITQGTHHQSEGSIPFGNNAPLGITIIAATPASPATPTSILNQIGDPNNPQQYSIISTGTALPNAKQYNQTSRFGWSGRCPGPIFAFPVVRPEGKTVTTGTLNVTFTNSVASVVATVIASYSMAIALELQQNGYYSYTLVEGV